jgi:ferredoxin
MRVVVDFDLCESNALCMAAAPEVFEVRDDDFLYVLQEEPPEKLRAKVEEAVRRCPKQAISIDDGPEPAAAEGAAKPPES